MELRLPSLGHLLPTVASAIGSYADFLKEIAMKNLNTIKKIMFVGVALLPVQVWDRSTP
jgi:hypothetical protein